MEILQSLANFIRTQTLGSIPESARDSAAMVLLDTVGCIAGGAQTELARTAIGPVAITGGAGPSTLVGQSRRADPVSAAYYNSLLADALDYEDSLLAHPSAAVVPAFKPYPACRYIHTTLDAVGELKTAGNGDLRPEEVRRVTVRSFSVLARWLADAQPATIVDAEFSVPHTIAVHMLGLEPGPLWYSPEVMGDERVFDLASRVRVEVSKEAERDYQRSGAQRSEVTIELDSGKTLSAVREIPRGAVEDPLSERELYEKFRNQLTGLPAADDEIESLWEQGLRFESVDSLTSYLGALRGAQQSATGARTSARI